MIGNTILQVIMAIIVILLLAFVSYSIYNSEIRANLYNLSIQNVTKKQVPIFKGIYSYNQPSRLSYNTNNSKYGDYIALDPSINQTGGAEYSYNFWLFKNADSPTTPLFIRGSSHKVRYNSSKYHPESESVSGWYLVKNPLITLVKGIGNHGIVVELNSISDIDGYKENKGKYNSNPGNDLLEYDSFLGVKNMNEYYNDKWTMITVVIQETNPSNDIIFRNKASVKIYVNGFLHMSKTIGSESSTAMRHNQGKLHINPGADPSLNNNSMIADLLYSNYVLTPDEIVALYKKDFTKTGMTMPTRVSVNNLTFDYSAVINNPNDITINPI
jgi:hypothetical protein